MTDLEDALTLIKDTLQVTLDPMREDGTIADLIFGSKTRGRPELPYIKIVFGKLKCISTTIGSVGVRESWEVPIKLGAVVKDYDEPIDGMIASAGLVSEARNRILLNRQLNIPQLIRKVDSTDIEIIPYPFGKKETLYGTGTTLTLLCIIDNK